MTQQQLAVRAFQGGEPRKSLISDLETGKIANPHQKTVDALAVCLEIPPEAVEGCRLNGALDRDALGVIIGDGLLSVHQAITAGLEQIAEDIALSKGLPVSPLRAILAKLGEVGVPDWNIPARLEAAADELICLRQRFSEIDTSNPASNLVRSSALEALDRGDLVEAQDLLRRGRAAAQGFREKAAEDEAGFIADQAKIEHILLAYKNAASHYFDASKLVSSFNKALQSHYLSCQAAEFEAQGREFGENEYLNAAIDVYTAAVTLVPAIQHPREYAETMRNLGFAQANLGEREPENSRLMQAVETYRKALKSIERARHPLLWASIQHHLGSALKALGERDVGTLLLKEAVSAYDAALEERSAEATPMEWASTQNNLGTTHQAIGERGEAMAPYERARQAYQAALMARTRAAAPYLWATTRDNLGVTLTSLGGMLNDGELLAEAALCHLDALEVRLRRRMPILWGRSQHNLGEALRVAGQRENGTESLCKAVRAFREALRERTRTRVPLQWANTWHELGIAWMAIGERTGDPNYLRRAVRAFGRALAERTNGHVPAASTATSKALSSAKAALESANYKAHLQ